MTEEFSVSNVFKGIKSKEMYPKIFAILIKSGVVEFLYQGVNYSFDEAIVSAISEAEKIAGNPKNNWQIYMFNWITLDDLNLKILRENFIVDKNINKNDLMKKIIESKDENLFNENISIFNEFEIKLIKDGIIKGRKNNK
jgi:hypothetical protein